MIARLAPLLLPPLAGCAMFQADVQVRDRYASLSPLSIGPTPTAEADPYRALRYQASVSTLDVPASEKSMPVTALSDRGQAAYVAALAAKTKDGAALAAALAKPLKVRGGDPSRFVDGSTIERRFVLSLTPVNGFLAPGDRLSWAKLRITPIDARFVDWTVAFNKRNAINVGSIKASQSTTLKAETGLKIGGPLTDTGVSGEMTRSLEESATINDQSTIDAMVTPIFAEVIQSGGWREDLTGNATFDASFTLPRTYPSFVYLLDGMWSDGKPAKAADVSLTRQTLALPDPSRPLCAVLTLDYVVRHLEAGARTFTEADDNVQLARGEFTSAPVEIAPAQRFPRFGLEVATGIIEIRVPGRQPEQLAVPDFDTAIALIDWINALDTFAPKLGAATLMVMDPARGGYRNLAKSDLSSLTTALLSGGPPTNGASEPRCSAMLPPTTTENSQ